MTLEILAGLLDADAFSGIVQETGELRVFVDPKRDATSLLLSLQKMVDGLVHEGLIEPQTLELETVEEVDWVGKWRSSLGAVRAGEHFIVVPPSVEAKSGEGDIVLRLEPRMAFGTGEHPTTRMALALLEPIAAPGMTVLDMGCGNGILSIAALLLGAEEALGVDNEEESVVESRENADLHGVGDRFRVVRADALAFTSTFRADLLVANIFFSPILQGMDNWLSMLKPGGWVIFTGVRKDDEGPKLVEACRTRGLFVDSTLDEDGWTAIRLRHQSA